jgi:pSer/pThr/pTyr-binding forkhead associated (FHA) protein
MEMFVQEYLEALQEMGEEAFRQNFDHPFFLFPDKHGTGDLKTYHTRMATKEAALDPTTTGKAIDQFRVLVPRHKRARADERLLVGRGEDRDVSIDHSTVSKRHAFLVLDAESGAYRLGDAGSTNGTFINGQRIESGKPVSLRDGCIISFGDCDYLFLSPAGFVELLQRMEEKK